MKEINNGLLAFCKQLDISSNKIKYPHIFLTYKFHKNPVKFRSVTNGFNTYISKSGRVLQNILQDTIDKFKDTSIIKNSHNVIKKVEQQEVFSVHGFDFEDLFNSIKIEDIIEINIKRERERERRATLERAVAFSIFVRGGKTTRAGFADENMSDYIDKDG
ncbi:hypothetical protein TNCV_774071 [Trichonephila clavipes]|nr:hypothetical protein TNCV_774071 [Trichonephila clavipes]